MLARLVSSEAFSSTANPSTACCNATVDSARLVSAACCAIRYASLYCDTCSCCVCSSADRVATSVEYRSSAEASCSCSCRRCFRAPIKAWPSSSMSGFGSDKPVASDVVWPPAWTMASSSSTYATRPATAASFCPTSRATAFIFDSCTVRQLLAARSSRSSRFRSSSSTRSRASSDVVSARAAVTLAVSAALSDIHPLFCSSSADSNAAVLSLLALAALRATRSEVLSESIRFWSATPVPSRRRISLSLAASFDLRSRTTPSVRVARRAWSFTSDMACSFAAATLDCSVSIASFCVSILNMCSSSSALRPWSCWMVSSRLARSSFSSLISSSPSAISAALKPRIGHNIGSQA